MAKTKKKGKKVRFLDVTTRDGAYIINFDIKPDQVAMLADYFEHGGIEYIEVGHGSGLGAAKLGYPSVATDLEYVTAVKKSVKKSKVGVLMPALTIVIPDLEEVAPYIDFARIGTMPGEVEKAAPLIAKTKELGKEVFLQLTRAPSLPPKKVAQEALKAQKMGADVVYLVDSMGSLTPKTIREYVKAIKDKVDLPLGFHGHNNLGLANINSVIAVEEGCEWIDASLLGVGRQAGNAQLELVALLLEREGYHSTLNVPFLLDVAETLVAPLFKNFKGIHPFDVWAAFWNVDLYPERFYRRLALELGLNIRDLAVEIAEMPDFVTMDDKHLKALIKKTGRNYSDVIRAVQRGL
jgi:4-hydroxy 2-oxovalerate aldolase